MGEQTGENENLVNGDKRKIGPFEVGPIGFGCWRFVNTDVGTATDRIAHALDLGLTLVDNADVYGLDWGGTAFGEAEALLGQVLARAPELRERMVLASKGGILPGVPYVANSTYLSSACDASLARLNTEHIDLYQIHRPDMLTHPAETAAALDGLALAFVLAHPARPVALIGSQTPARLTQAVNALEITLTRADVYALIEAREGVPLP